MFRPVSLTTATAFLAFSTVSSVLAAPIVFDLKTLTMTVPEVVVGASSYNLLLQYEADGRLSIKSATPVPVPPAGASCSLQTTDVRGNVLQLSFSKVIRADPSQPGSAAEPFIKMVGKSIKGIPLFCPRADPSLAIVQSGRQLSSDAKYEFRADAMGPDAGYDDCATLSPGTQSILFGNLAAIQAAATFFNPSSPFTVTYTQPEGNAVSASCAL